VSVNWLGERAKEGDEQESDQESWRPNAAIAIIPHLILVVEDEAFVREVTCEILERAGYDVLKARNGAEARGIFHHRSESIQLLLTDVVLPGENGRELATYLKTKQPGLKTIFISGYPENTISRNGLQPEGISYLPKPFSVESLMQKVTEVLPERKKAKRAAGTG
jgi:two-component system, cell cycle sensor histidine kinase and response regulator CckA